MNCGPSAGEGRTVRRSTDWKTTFYDVSGGLDVQVADRPQELRDAPARPPATSPATALVGVCS